MCNLYIDFVLCTVYNILTTTGQSHGESGRSRLKPEQERDIKAGTDTKSHSRRLAYFEAVESFKEFLKSIAINETREIESFENKIGELYNRQFYSCTQDLPINRQLEIIDFVFMYRAGFRLLFFVMP